MVATLTYERYLRREIAAASLLALAAFAALFAFFDFMHELEDLGKGGYALRHALAFVLLSLPGRIYEVLPIAVLIGALYALTLLARHAEITVLRASGLATTELAFALARIGAIFVALTFAIGEFIAPPAEKAAQKLRLSAQSQLVGQEFRSGLWVKDGATFINVREVTPDAVLQGVRIFEFADDFRLVRVIEAREGRYAQDGQWELVELKKTRFTESKASVERLPRERWQTALDPDILAVMMVVPERMTLVHLLQYIRHLTENRQQTQRYEIALWKKAIYPLTVWVMIFLALPFAYLSDRTAAVSARVFIGVLVGVSFHAAHGLFSHLGQLKAWPPFLAASAPALLFFAGALIFLGWVERR
ncbi:MAG: LPS export ABC transporter permease LptG [Rhodocyclaceae bacterium]|nr:LPS export ABC transporter permease LptG [Rhodocyclaceae bacterium]